MGQKNTNKRVILERQFKTNYSHHLNIVHDKKKLMETNVLNN